jgi:putative heme degradation protein
MTDFLIKQQRDDIKKVLSKAAQSKEAAINFLTNAGLIEIKSQKISKAKLQKGK